MLTDQEFTELLEDMNSGELGLLVGGLKDLWRYPSADERVLPYLEERLEDKTPCVLGYPYLFGEIRWLAAQALAAERAALGINQPVRVMVVKPAETMDIMAAEYEAKIDGEGGVEGLLESLAILRDMGYMPMKELKIWPLGESAPSTRIVMTQQTGVLELVPA
ncbi:MAG: hypothetical protein ACPGWR_08070 [Ardenticatenaceae bacterium]